MDLTERTVEQETIFQGRVITLRRDKAILPNGKITTREVVVHPGAAAVVPVTDDGKIWLVEQYRYAIGRTMLEIPAGKLDTGEAPLLCAQRELQEETGAVGGDIFELGKIYTSVGFCNECIYLYYATGFEMRNQHPDEDEFLRIHAIPGAQVLAQVLNGTLTDAKTVAAIVKLYALHPALFES